MAAQGFPARRVAGLLNVSESGFYAWRERPASARRLRHVWLTRLILDIHRESGSAFGYRRIRQVLEHRFGIRVSHGTVELLMHQAGIRGRPGGVHERTGLARHAVPSGCRTTGVLARPTREGPLSAMPAPDERYRHLPDGGGQAAAGPDPDQQPLEGSPTENSAAAESPDAVRGGFLTRAFADRDRRTSRASDPAALGHCHDHAAVEEFRGNTPHALAAPGTQPAFAPLRTELSEILGGLVHLEYALGRNPPS
ncbi:IS3 family transposase [Streptomyces fagopyri]|uniref:IS3 family transposase n=1 Tax=Streptomyces fagopyri TaxID=2662397 RepID=UPI00380CC641